MVKKIFLVGLFILFTMNVYAHSGRLDGTGGHRVNKEWLYQGKYIVAKDGIKHIQSGELIFNNGDYHFHCKPNRNGFINGFYIPIDDKDIKNATTINVSIQKENVLASRNSNLYHKTDCQYIKNIREENLVIFEDIEDAKKNGYIPDKNCFSEVEQ